jgi:hypothetical protein
MTEQQALVWEGGPLDEAFAAIGRLRRGEGIKVLIEPGLARVT